MAAAFKMFGIYTERAAAFFLLACNSVFSAAIALRRCTRLPRGVSMRMASRGVEIAKYARAGGVVVGLVVGGVSGGSAVCDPLDLGDVSLSTCLFTWSLVITLRLRAKVRGDRGRGPRRTSGEVER